MMSYLCLKNKVRSFGKGFLDKLCMAGQSFLQIYIERQFNIMPKVICIIGFYLEHLLYLFVYFHYLSTNFFKFFRHNISPLWMKLRLNGLKSVEASNEFGCS